MPIQVKDNTVVITTPRLTAVFDGPDLVELRSARAQVPARQGARRIPAITLGFVNGEQTPLCVSPYHSIRVIQLGETVVHVHVEDENGDACVRLRIDERQRLVIEPSAQTIRRGLCAVHWVSRRKCMDRPPTAWRRDLFSG